MTSHAHAVTPFFVALMLAPSVTGCSRSPAPPDLALFLGTWDPQPGGALSVACSNGQNPSGPVAEPTVLGRGTASHLVDLDAACPTKYDVSGAVATALPGQTCKNRDVVTDLHIMTDTFTVTGRGSTATATHAASGRLSGFIDVSMAVPVKCTFTETATYRRRGATP